MLAHVSLLGCGLQLFHTIGVKNLNSRPKTFDTKSDTEHTNVYGQPIQENL